MRDSKGQFQKGVPAPNKVPVGTIRIRTRHKRGGDTRAFIKVAEPNVWIPNARYVWEQSNGPIPAGYAIHHIDHNPLNDDITNLELVRTADHLERHRAEYLPKTIEKLVSLRRTKRWSTKAKNKPEGWQRTYTEDQFIQARDAYLSGKMNKTQAEQTYGLPLRTLYYRGVRGK